MSFITGDVAWLLLVTGCKSTVTLHHSEAPKLYSWINDLSRWHFKNVYTLTILLFMLVCTCLSDTGGPRFLAQWKSSAKCSQTVRTGGVLSDCIFRDGSLTRFMGEGSRFHECMNSFWSDLSFCWWAVLSHRTARPFGQKTFSFSVFGFRVCFDDGLGQQRVELRWHHILTGFLCPTYHVILFLHLQWYLQLQNSYVLEEISSLKNVVIRDVFSM